MEQSSDVIKNTDSFYCSNCGGILRWNISKQVFSCSSCGVTVDIDKSNTDIKKHDFDQYKQRAEGSVSFPDESVVICKTCGAQITIDKATTATVCSMCASTYIDVEKQMSGIMPDGLIPFKVDKHQAQDNFRKWVKKTWTIKTTISTRQAGRFIYLFGYLILML